MYLICHVTLHDHVIKESTDFMEGSSSFNVTSLPGLVATGCGSGNVNLSNGPT